MENNTPRYQRHSWSIMVSVWPRISMLHKIHLLWLAYTSVGKRERILAGLAVLIVAGLLIYISSGSWAWAFLIGALVGIAFYALLKQ
jgi:hypothetical protein